MTDTGLSHIPGIEVAMTRHGLRCLIAKMDHYSPILVRGFYAAYVTTMFQDLPKGKKPFNQPRLQDVSLRGRRVDISEEMIDYV